MIDAAEMNSEENHVLLIDEINRGNVSKILGECFTALDRDEDYAVLANKVEEDEETPSKVRMHIPEKSLHYRNDEYLRPLVDKNR